MVLQITPVWVGLGDVPADRQLIGRFSDNHRNVGGERAFVGIRNEDDEWIGAHERQSSSAIFIAEVFRDVHPLIASRCETITTEVTKVCLCSSVPSAVKIF